MKTYMLHDKIYVPYSISNILCSIYILYSVSLLVSGSCCKFCLSFTERVSRACCSCLRISAAIPLLLLVLPNRADQIPACTACSHRLNLALAQALDLQTLSLTGGADAQKAWGPGRVMYCSCMEQVQHAVPWVEDALAGRTQVPPVCSLRIPATDRALTSRVSAATLPTLHSW